jgi:hypothetical protein
VSFDEKMISEIEQYVEWKQALEEKLDRGTLPMKCPTRDHAASINILYKCQGQIQVQNVRHEYLV